MNSDRARDSSRAFFIFYVSHLPDLPVLPLFGPFAKHLQLCYHSPIITLIRKETGP
jgi:hypothetical protein